MVILYLLVTLIPVLAFVILMIGYLKYKDVLTSFNGYDMANKVLESHDLGSLYIVLKKGFFNDEYDFNRKVIRLSSDVYNKNNIVSMMVGAYMGVLGVMDKENKLGWMKLLDKVIELILIVSYVGLALGLVVSIQYANIFIMLLVFCYIYYFIVFIFNLSVFKKVEEEFTKFELVGRNGFSMYYSVVPLCKILIIVIGLVKNN